VREPVQARGKATVARILDAATALLVSGDVSFSVRSLATQANVSLATIYQFFSDVDAVIAAVQQSMVERMDQRLKASVPMTLASDPKAFFLRLIETVDALQREHPEYSCIVRPDPQNAMARTIVPVLRKSVDEYMALAFASHPPPPSILPTSLRLEMAALTMLSSLTRAPEREAQLRQPFLEATAKIAAAILDSD
jgi:AcrR family transcriptional regulator